MKEGNIFQTVVIGIFIVLAVAGVIFFSVFKPAEKAQDYVGDIVVWGTLERQYMQELRTKTEEMLPDKYVGSLTFVSKNEDSFHEELLEALASGNGPDLFLLEHKDLLKQSNKIWKIPYDNFPARIFKDTYLEGAEIFIDTTGVYALPLMIDPLVMYWNRDILTNARITGIPKYWIDFLTISPKLTKRDRSSDISQATVAFGEYSNITNAQEIISALVLQADDPIVIRDSTDNPSVVFGALPVQNQEQPAVSAIDYYTQFADPIKSVYSWNRSLPESRQHFIAGDLAFYFGFASEISELRELNPNLNFDVAVMPQILDDRTPATFGNITGVAILKSTDNIAGSLRVAKLISSDDIFSAIHDLMGLPPVSRKLISQVPSDAISPIYYESALISRGWLEPDSEKVDTIFKNMIESKTSGRQSTRRAVAEAKEDITNLLR
jgi:ABC-type glycerol-3-phosphate transport system substrate-binding protein